MGLRLHIGCGRDIRAGFVNIDEFSAAADVRAPIQALKYADNSVERIEGFMVLEHLSPSDAAAFARNACRMLQSGGTLVLECPDLEKVCRLILIFKDDPYVLERGAFGLRGLFGEPTDTMTLGDYHKWGYTPTLAVKLLKEAGFQQISVQDGMSHAYPLRDMRIVATK
jgi:hypothetical protein